MTKTALRIVSAGLLAPVGVLGMGLVSHYDPIWRASMATNITDQEIEAIMADLQAAGNAWMCGDAAPFGRLMTESEDFTILGPFGGPAAKGHRNWAQIAPLIAKNFQRGASKIRLVQSYTSGDLLVLVLDEEQHGELFGGQDQPWSLRSTQVYRREGEKWKIVHRHADPLVRMRSPQETIALARG